MGNFFRKNWLELSIFSLIFLILAFFASKTWLQSDDINFIFPAITNNFGNFYKNYISDYGLFRPFALIYYFFIFKIFTIFPNITHLIPISILTITSLISFKVFLKQGFSDKKAFGLSLLLLTIPIVTEAYSWISANICLIVLLIFFLEIYLIESDNKKNLMTKVLLLQITSVFFYETTFFLGPALAYLFYVKKQVINKVKLVTFLVIPPLLYLTSKLLIKPQFETRSKFIKINEIIANWQSFLSWLKALFSNLYFNSFWKLEYSDGLKYIKHNFIIGALMTIIFVLVVFLLFKKNKSIDYGVTKNQSTFNFWFLTFLLSLVPLSWQNHFLPFRILILPVFSITICLFFVFKHSFLDFYLKIIFIIVIFFFITIQISMINQYVNQYFIDKKITMEIDDKLENSGFEHPYRSNLYLKNFSYNNVGQIIYGDYIYGLYHNYWSAEALLDLNSGSFAKVAIEVPADNYFTAKNIGKEDFLKLRPLTIMSFTDNKSCLTGECLKVEAVYQHPY